MQRQRPAPARLRRGEFPAFVPRTANWGLSLNRERFNLRANWNYRGRQRRAAIAAGNSIEPGTYTWWSKRLYVDLNGEYYFYKRLALFASLRNVGRLTRRRRGLRSQHARHAQFRQRIQFGSLWMFGVKGTF